MLESSVVLARETGLVKRYLAVAGGAVAPTVASLGFPGPASGTPASGGTAGQPSCVFTLSHPAVVPASGAQMVSAKLTPYPCTGVTVPNALTVCLKSVGGSTAGNCVTSAGPSTPEVLVPYVPGTTYVATGTGCSAITSAEGLVCSAVGPYSAGL